MPRVSAFYGIVITMYPNEYPHPGRPHFHARYAGAKATYDIQTSEAIAGRLHPRANRLVVRWGRLHQFELRRSWDLVRASKLPCGLILCDELSTLMLMEITPDLVDAKPTQGCGIWLRWEDGLAAEVDFSYLLDFGGVFGPLRNPDFFRQVKVGDGAWTIEWPGEVDVAPETAYRRTQEAAGVAA